MWMDSKQKNCETMAVQPYLKGVVLLALLMSMRVSPAAAETETGGTLRSQLLLELGDAIRSFNRGSALLKSAPEEALVAFRAAHDRFHAVAHAGIENGRLYYNLGNTHLRLGEIGAAIADYRRAKRLIPGDERLEANLRFARSLRLDNIADSGKRTLLRTLLFGHYSWPLHTRRNFALIAYSLFWLALAIRLISPNPLLRYMGVICLVGWVSLGASVAVELHARSHVNEGVLISSEVVVRKGDGEAYEPQFTEPLHQAVEFKVIEHRHGWIHIELPDGNRGWVRERDAELF